MPQNPLWWASRIAVEKAGRPLDVEQRRENDHRRLPFLDTSPDDGSPHVELGLYPDDTLMMPLLARVHRRPWRCGMPCTKIEIFACMR